MEINSFETRSLSHAMIRTKATADEHILSLMSTEIHIQFSVYAIN